MEWSTRDVSRPANKASGPRFPRSHSADTGTSGGDDRGAPPARVLVVEDEESFVDALTVNLERKASSSPSRATASRHSSGSQPTSPT